MLEMKVRVNGGAERTAVAEENESAVFKEVAAVLADAPVPSTVEIESERLRALYEVRERGTYVKDGTVHPSRYIVEAECECDLAPSAYEEAYLTAVNEECNQYKFYRIKPACAGEIECEYGRIGDRSGRFASRRPVRYASRLYWIRYLEKIGKGYVDQSDVYLTPECRGDAGGEAEEPAEETDSTRLRALLMGFARNAVRSALACEHVSEGQVKRSREILGELSEAADVGDFNRRLLELMSICPRRIGDKNTGGVRALLAESESDYERIANREESLVLAMEAVAGKRPEGGRGHGSFPDGISVREATPEEEAEVRGMLDPEQDGMLRTLYRVDSARHRARFEERCRDRGITDVKRFWHGSRSENWCSIVENGLLLNPNAAITGKMFGNGIYTAPDSGKSWGYTSARGYYWARGTSDTGIMGLYAAAYGKPYDVTRAGWYDQEFLDARGCDCVHAHRGSGLYRDEVVFYDEAALCLEYLAIFG